MAWTDGSCPGRSGYAFLEGVWFAAARWARAAKLLEATWPLPARAWADWMRPAALGVIGVRAVDADFLDMIRISS